MAGRDRSQIMGSSGVDMTIRSLTVYANLSPWDDWTEAIRDEMKRRGIPYSERNQIEFTILRQLNMKPKKRGKSYDKKQNEK